VVAFSGIFLFPLLISQLSETCRSTILKIENSESYRLAIIDRSVMERADEFGTIERHTWRMRGTTGNEGIAIFHLDRSSGKPRIDLEEIFSSPQYPGAARSCPNGKTTLK